MKLSFKIAIFSLLLGLAPLTFAQQADSININTADVETLTMLPGIGTTKAEAIVADREANGLYQSADDLTRISGIGNATVENMRDQIAF